MNRRTLRYACMVLLCCALGVLMVYATQAVKQKPAHAMRVASSLQTTAAPSAKPGYGVSDTRTVKTLPEEDKSAGMKAGADEKSSMEATAPNEGPLPLESTAVQRAADELRKQRERAAMDAGFDPFYVSSLSDEELVGLLASPGSHPTRDVPAVRPTSEIVTPTPEMNGPAPTDSATAAGAPEEEIKRFEGEPPPEEPVFSAGSESPPSVSASAEAPASGEVPYVPLTDPRMAEAKDALTAMREGRPLTPEQKDLAYDYLVSHPEETEPGRGPLDNIGGPDAGGYRFMDNYLPDTCNAAWVELRTDPGTTWLTFGSYDDAISGSCPMGFSFPFYGTNYTQFWVSTNGNIQFNTQLSSLSNVCLPATSGVTGPAVFPYWDDLHLQRGGNTSGNNVIGCKNFGTYTVIEFDSIGFYSCSPPTNGSLKFEVILYSSGRIAMLYDTLNFSTCGGSMTVGIQDTSLGPALQYTCNTTGIALASHRKIWFYQVWYDENFACTNIISPLAAVYPPSSVQTVSARFTNWGNNTRSAPVKYQFYTGGTVSEATASLAQFAYEDHSFSTPITMPADTGIFLLTVWSDLADDQDRSNDTLRRQLHVMRGMSCSDPMLLNGVTDTVSLNNCGTGDNDPGQPCGASGQDMVFYKSVTDGQQIEIWQPTNSIESRHTLRWGGACPGVSVVHCTDEPDNYVMRFVNHTGSVQTVYFTVGGYSTATPCGAFDLAWNVTACNPLSPPLVESFETPVVPALPSCWSIENTDGVAPVWESYATGGLNNLKCATISGNAAGNNDWLFTPGLSLNTGTTYFFEYWRKANSATYPESLEVKAGTGNASSAMTLTILPLDSFKTTTYVQKYTTFTVPITGVYYVAFHGLSRQSSCRTYVDSVQVQTGACSAPTVNVPDNTGYIAVTLTATAGGGFGGPLQYQWYTGGTCQSGSEIAGATASSFVAFSSGTYSCRAWRGDPVNCSACDSALATVNPDTCGIQNVPYVENFDAVTAPALPTCWAQENTNNLAPTWVTSSTNSLTAPNNAYITGVATINNDWLFSPRVHLFGGTQYVLQYYRRAVTGQYHDSLEVKYGPNRHSTGMIYPIFPPDTSRSSAAYVQQSAVFAPAADGDYYIGWHSLANSASAGTRVDSAYLYAFGPCAAPTVTVAPVAAPYAALLTATASGGTGGPLRYQWYSGDCATGTIIPGATSRLYWATQGGIYACRVARGPLDSATCSACDTGEVTLTCASQALPFFDGFEGPTVPALPTCWSREDANFDSRYWVSSTSYYHAGTKSAYINYTLGGMGPVNDWLYTPGFDLTGGNTYVVDYWYRASSSSYTERLEVLLGTQPAAPYMTAAIVDSPFSFTTSTWTLRTKLFTPPANGRYLLGFHAISPNNQLGIYLDDFRVYAYGTCTAPDSVRVAPQAGQDSVTLTCNVYGGWGGPIQYRWYTGLACASGNEIPGAAASTYIARATGVYSCKAWRGTEATCSGCDSAYAEVHDCQTAAVLPVVEGFEATTGTSLPWCWRYQDVNGDANYWKSTTTNPHIGLRDAYIYTYAASGTVDDWMFGPKVYLDASTTYLLEYWFRAYSTSYTERMEVKFGTSQTAAGMTSGIIDTVFTFNSATYSQHSRTFRPATSGNYYVGWHAMSNALQYGYIYVDDIAISVLGTCTAPDSVRVASVVAQDSVTLRAVVYGGTGGPAQYQWYTGVNCASGTEIPGATADSLRVYVSGVYSCRGYRLDPNTCGACDSAYATVINCSIGAPVTPFSEGFEGLTVPALPPCWIQQDGDGDSRPWGSSTNYPRTGTRSVYVLYTPSGVYQNDWLISRGVALEAGRTYLVDYWTRLYLTSYTERMEVKVGTARDSSAMTTTIEPVFQFNNGTYVQHVDTIRPGTTGTYYVGWHLISDPNQGGVIMDDIMIYEMGTCSAPTVTVPDASGTIYVSLTATASGGYGGALQYQWYTGSTCQGGNEIAGATGSVYYATTSGMYSCKAWRANPTTCAACDSAAATVTPDPCLPGYTVTPFLENFNSVTTPNLPTCWSRINANGDGNQWVTTSTSPYSTPYCAYMSDNNAGNDDWLFSPPLQLSGGVQYMLDYFRRAYSTSYMESLEVKFGPAPVPTSMATWIAGPDTFRNTTYEEKTATFTPLVTGSYYVGWHDVTRVGYGGIYMDDAMVYPVGTCGAPTVSVADCTVANDTGGVRMAAVATGGYGGPFVYQWYRGGTCNPANAMAGETGSTFFACSTGTYSCKVYRGDPVACAACDSGRATIGSHTAPNGYDCCNIIWLTGASDSATYNNCNMGNSSPGQPCGFSQNDMVFGMVVPPGNLVSIWQYYNAIDSRHTLAWGGGCPGVNIVGCIDDPDYTQYFWENTTGQTQNVYFTIGGYYASTACGEFRLQWLNSPPCPQISCTPTVVEAEPNTGCASTPAQAFNAFAGNAVISGSVTATTTLRDVDAYEVVLDVARVITLDVSAEFDVLLWLYSATAPGACPDQLIAFANDSLDCQRERIVSECVPPGVYHIYVAPPFTQITSPKDYCLTVTFGACPTGRCCYGPDPLFPLCEVNYLYQCDLLGGHWTQGLTCATPCPTPRPCPAGSVVSQIAHLPADDWIAGVSEVSTGYWVYEDFGPVTTPIGHIRFWGLNEFYNGSSWEVCTESPMPFEIRFFADSLGPTSEAAAYNVTLTGTSTGLTYDGATLFEYETDLNPPLGLPVGWVSVRGAGNANCWFLWMSAYGGDGYSLLWVADSSRYFDTEYDAAVCLGAAPCLDPLSLTAYLSSDQVHPWLRFVAPMPGEYDIYQSTVKNNDGDPRFGDPNFTLVASIRADTIGTYTWTDPDTVRPYKNYVLVTDCSLPVPLGRCCYGDSLNPSCVDSISKPSCDTLGGHWTHLITCNVACPVADTCADAFLTAPGIYNGNTCNAGNDCGTRASTEQVVRVTIPTAGSWIFTMCQTSPVWDSYMYVDATCCAPAHLGYNDDFCGSYGNSQVTVTLQPGMYYVLIEGFASDDCGAYVLDVHQ